MSEDHRADGRERNENVTEASTEGSSNEDVNGDTKKSIPLRSDRKVVELPGKMVVIRINMEFQWVDGQASFLLNI